MNQVALPTVDDFTPGSKALAVKQNREVEVVSAKQQNEDSPIIVKVKGLDPENVDKIMNLAAVSKGQVFLRPVNGETESIPSEDEETPEVKVKEEGDFFKEEEPVAEDAPVETPAEPVSEDTPEPAKEEDTAPAEDLDDREELLKMWMDSGLEEGLFVKKYDDDGEKDLVREICGRLVTADSKVKKASRAPRETNWETAKMRKFFDLGEFQSTLDWMEDQELIDAGSMSEEEIEKAEKEMFDAIGIVIGACQYSGTARRVKTKEVNTATPKVFTELYRRLVSIYPALVKYNLVEDIYKVSIRKQ